MELTHTFTVPATLERTWEALGDIEAVAGCFPGAVVTSVDGDTFHGSCKVKLGPIALVYNGSGTFVERDEAGRTMRIEARGKDKRGNGTAGADVIATLTDTGEGTTEVEVLTELNITGKPAQFGRGVMQDVSDKLLGQFVACLKEQVGDAPAPVGDEAVGPETVSEPPPQPATQPPPGETAARAQDGDDALDLGAAVLPVLARTYGKQIVAGLGVLFLLVWWWRRRRGAAS
jgi:carbon monoxide dehydrogenase subunit G